MNLITYPTGYYEVGKATYIHKSDALYLSTKIKRPARWNFHDDIYSQLDWTQRPVGTLTELYRQRAQQLRDTYDYLVVNFSGGADSWTVLNSFLSNGIHVDEVYTRWAFDERKYKQANTTDTTENNLISEYEYAVEPVLKDIEKRFPRTRIHVEDYSDAYQKTLVSDKFEIPGHFLTMGLLPRFSRKSPGELDAEAQGRKVGIVHGWDKIQCLVENGEFFAYFVDRAVITDDTRSTELFYWSREFPLLPVAQAHEMKHFYETHPGLLSLPADDHRLAGKNTYISVCYPDYNINTFQVGKAKGSVIWDSEEWIREYNPDFFNSWKWSVNQYLPTINPEYCHVRNGDIFGYKPMKSQKYLLGPTSIAINHSFFH